MENEGPTAAFSTTLSIPLFAQRSDQMMQAPAPFSPKATEDMGDEELEFSPPMQADAAASLDTPIHAPFVNHFESSNLRGNDDDVPQEEVQQIPSSPSHGAKTAANILANGNGYTNDELANLYAQSYAVLDNIATDDPFTDDGERTNFAEEERSPMQAYAKLTMPDGDYYVTSLRVVLGRDMDFWKRYTREKKRAEKAQQALEEYALEPSQPSQPDDIERNAMPSSKSSQSLVGRPSGALPSNYSEQGGAVSYPAQSDDEEYTRPSRRRRRKTLISAASSISVAPASLHPNMLDLSASSHFDTENGHVADTPGFVGIHPANRDDIRLISKEHLCFEYNSEEEQWQLQVLGNRAFVNNELHQKGSIVVLNHDDEIIVTSVSIKFRLPENRNSPGPSRGTFADSRDLDFSDEDEEVLSEFSSSPHRRISNTVDEDESDEDEEDEPRAQKTTKKTPKLKLSLKKARKGSKTDKDKPVKLSLKQRKAEQEAGKRPEKGKKPKFGSKQPEEPSQGATAAEPDHTEAAAPLPPDTVKDEEGSPQASAPSAPAPPPVIEPGSIFEGVAAEELPQKRKGPGRPPKNGLISKRDQSFVKRKLKEYEKRGQAPPPMDELVAIVRAENKAKELAAKAAARGEMMPDMNVMPSIETDGSRPGGASAHDPNKPSVPAEPVRRSSPKPKRIVKSPSPMKPESEYTEDEMKKPTVTYVHILDEVLRDHPTGKADLQEIYDRICKRYPYFKYRVNTAGWQSSVRHNLLQHDRFVENGRSGKGRLWTINFDCPIDREKKRRVTPPPRPQVPPQNGQYGHAQYNAQAQPPVQPNGPYYSPYAQTSFVQAPRPPQPAQPISKQPVQQQPAAPQQSPSASAFQEIVARILVFRSTYLSRFPPESDAYKEHDMIFNSCTNHVSAIFHGTTESVELKSEEEKKVFKELENIVKVYQGKEVSVKPGESVTPQPAPQANPTQPAAQMDASQTVSQPIAAPPMQQETTNPPVQSQPAPQPLQPQPAMISQSQTGVQPASMPADPTPQMPIFTPPIAVQQGQIAPPNELAATSQVAQSTEQAASAPHQNPDEATPAVSGEKAVATNPLKRSAEDDQEVDEAKRVKTE